MKDKQLENYFKEDQGIHPQQVSEDGYGAIIYSENYFHINAKQKTIYIKDLGVIPLEEMEENIEQPDWIAITNTGGVSNLVMGSGNPYSQEYADVLPTENGVVIAVPYSIMQKFLKAH